MAVKTVFAVAALAMMAQAKICGTTGYETDTDSYYYNDSGSQGSYAVCSKLCSDDTQCKSFAFSSSECELFNVAVQGNFDSDSSSPYHFYDRACISAATSSSKKASTSSTKATSSTKTSPTSSTKATSILTSTSTTSKVASKSSSTAAAASSSGIAIPAGCNVPLNKTITSFSWFNSTHNCDCAASHPDVGDGTGCLGPDGNWCDPKVVANCTDCGIGVCMTGLPPQPVGYGPPDDVTFGFSDGFSCEQTNPRGFKPREVGQEALWCGGPFPSMSFIANSNAASSYGVVTYGDAVYCDGGATAYTSYNASFLINCVHDAQHNATCTTPGNVVMPLVGIQVVQPQS